MNRRKPHGGCFTRLRVDNCSIFLPCFYEQFPDLKLTGKHLTYLLKEIGSNRTRIIKFFKELGIPNDSILFDGVDLIDFLKEIKKVKIEKLWVNSEITKKTSDLLDKINIPITYE